MKKRYITVILIIFCGIIVQAQIEQDEFSKNIVNQFSTAISRTIYADELDIKGSVYLFDEWNNTNTIYLYDGKTNKVDSININVNTNKLVIRRKGLIYNINNEYYEHIVINNKVYKMFFSYEENKNKIYEIIVKAKKHTLLKGFKVRFIASEVKPYQLDNNKADEYKKLTSYYIKNKNSIKRIKLKKRNILKLFKDKKEAIITFVKNNKLSYKKEKDVKKIFKYYNNL